MEKQDLFSIIVMKAIEMKEVKDVTIYDIAKALDLSPATISRGLKDHPGIKKETKKRIVEAARQMGYQHNTFARNLRVRKTNTIGVIIPRLNSYFMSTVIAGMEKVANERGYNLIISQSQESVKKEIASVNTMYNSRVDGLLVSLAYDTENIDHFSALLKKEIPLIFFDRIAEHIQCTSIAIDNVKAGYEATLHLIDQGCRRIVYIGGNLKRNVYADRLKGYRLALMERELPQAPELVIINHMSEQEGSEAAQALMRMKPRPDGVFAANDTVAVTCIREFRRQGLCVPNDIAVVGFNNDPNSRVIEPNLTTVDYLGHEMGEIAAATLINTIEKKPSAHLNTLLLRHNLIVRQSSVRSHSTH
ncbi:LacI family transcriptional regulator [Catalinimonas alkaloidigena]|uniref:LacI family transcriptional regulator n=1 Tax=Catalinimonas alkaloidigena TaxID=1075417 RepID=A0A1G9PQ55_9BACT|nr:LacI family DNA-binding transcriptional regulator [Catalinimonas alkaloidigena]SDM00910.1 LacI family transcriptional regulator [Catalinimonas alkaloidigena]